MAQLIESLSPKLKKIAERSFPQHLSDITKAFEMAIEFGGATEINFTRPEGASFNPRAARIPQLVLELGMHTSPESFISAILHASSCSPNYPKQIITLYEGTFCKIVCEILTESFKLKNQIEENQPFEKRPARPESSMIAICSFIDRCRHAHLVSHHEIMFCLERLPHLYSIISPELIRTKNILLNWEKRALILTRKNN